MAGVVYYRFKRGFQNPICLMKLACGFKKPWKPDGDFSFSDGEGPDSSSILTSEQMAPRGQLVFCVGIGAFLFVPVFKAVTGLPPYMGMLFGLGVLWILTDAIHYGESERQKLKVLQALSRIDTQRALFFLGILLSVSSLARIVVTPCWSGVCRDPCPKLCAHCRKSVWIAWS